MSTVLVPTANTKQAIANAKAAVGQGSDYTGMCEAFTRSNYGFPAMYSSAYYAYRGAVADGGFVASNGHDAPPGSVFFWDITYGSNAPYDHVAPVTETGVVCSTSAGPNKTVARVGIQDLTARWGMTPRGYTTIYHGVELFTREDPTPDPEDEMKYRGYSTDKDQKLTAGSWHTLKITDDNDLSMTFENKPFHALVQIAATGQAPGTALQVRFKLIDVKSGQDSTRHLTYPITEILGTDGTTFGQAAQYGEVKAPASGWSRRLRAEILTYSDNVVVTSVQARSFQ